MSSPLLKTLMVVLLALSAWGCSEPHRHYRYREATPYGYYGGSGTYGPPYGGRYERRDCGTEGSGIVTTTADNHGQQ